MYSVAITLTLRLLYLDVIDVMYSLIHTKVATFSRFLELLFVFVRNTSIQTSDNWLKLFLEKTHA